jgi:hypothetical protein
MSCLCMWSVTTLRLGGLRLVRFRLPSKTLRDRGHSGAAARCQNQPVNGTNTTRHLRNSSERRRPKASTPHERQAPNRPPANLLNRAAVEASQLMTRPLGLATRVGAAFFANRRQGGDTQFAFSARPNGSLIESPAYCGSEPRRGCHRLQQGWPAGRKRFGEAR